MLTWQRFRFPAQEELQPASQLIWKLAEQMGCGAKGRAEDNKQKNNICYYVDIPKEYGLCTCL